MFLEDILDINVCILLKIALFIGNVNCFYFQVGGLGDVVSGLGKALQRRGHLVEVVLPKYDCMQHERIQELRV